MRGVKGELHHIRGLSSADSFEVYHVSSVAQANIFVLYTEASICPLQTDFDVSLQHLVVADITKDGPEGFSRQKIPFPFSRMCRTGK